MSNCIESTYCKDRDGYAVKWDPITKKVYHHHRLSFCEFHSLPMSSIKGLQVCHKCDNRPCINPLHLFLGTNADNVRDRNNKDRQARLKGIDHGRAILTEADVLAIRGSSLSRYQLGVKYNVHVTTVSRVLKRETWRHI